MKQPADNPQGYRRGHEPKKICIKCGEYMYKQSSRKMINGRNGWIPTSWLCRKCGYMVLDLEGFEAVKID